MKQTDKILMYMQTEGEITPLDALREFNCMRLAARISDLRKAGHKIGRRSFQTASASIAERRWEHER